MIYAENFIDFQVQVAKTALNVAKHYYSDEHLVPAIGRDEYVNIPEFRAASPLSHQIIVEEQADDMESKMGKFITLRETMQYGSKNLEKDDFGKILRLMPYTNKEQIFEDLPW